MRGKLIDRIRHLVIDSGMAKVDLARAAGVCASALSDCNEPGWSPTTDTLGKLEHFLVGNDDRPVIASIEEVIDEARNGRMFILVDDEDRENEGALIIPAQMATPAVVNFMATHGRGLICLALTGERCQQLGLHLMSRGNGTRHEAAFTVSIEGREGVTTGISAADRARTISVAVNGSMGRDDIVTPGHVFPLRARDGGVLVRAGHTEAAVDISRLAGLNPSGVICEIMRDDGAMARLEDLVRFARLHDLKIGTIRDLIAYRRKHDHLVVKKAELLFKSRWGGDWRAVTYFNKATGDETMALVKGHPRTDKPTLVRMHTLSIFADIYGEEGERCDLLNRSMEIIGEEGAGIIVVINRPMPSLMSRSIELRKGARDGLDPPIEELRDYGVGAQILTELGVQDMILLTNTHHSLAALEGYGLSIVGERPIH